MTDKPAEGAGSAPRERSLTPIYERSPRRWKDRWVRVCKRAVLRFDDDMELERVSCSFSCMGDCRIVKPFVPARPPQDADAPS